MRRKEKGEWTRETEGEEKKRGKKHEGGSYTLHLLSSSFYAGAFLFKCGGQK